MFLFSSTVKEGFFHFGSLEFGEMVKLLKLQFKILKYSISSKRVLTKHLWKISDTSEVLSVRWNENDNRYQNKLSAEL